jgi:hypothetical protein
MPVYALFNFDDQTTMAMDSAPLNGDQFGYYLNGASASGVQAQLHGENDLIKIVADPAFQFDGGKLEIQFTLSQAPLTHTQAVVSRDSVGDTPGGFRVEILSNGAVQVFHETGAGVEVTTTEPGFVAPGQEINLTYSWAQGGDGGQMNISNLSSCDDFSAPVSDGVTMGIGASNQPYIIGAGQSNSDNSVLNNIDQHFAGTVEGFSLTDTVDNNENNAPDANTDTASTGVEFSVAIDVLQNDTDADGNALTISGTRTATNGTVSIDGVGHLVFAPDAGFEGDATITHMITDGNGGSGDDTPYGQDDDDYIDGALSMIRSMAAPAMTRSLAARAMTP